VKTEISLARRILAAVAHVGWLVGIGYVLIALAVWLVFRNDDFVRPHAKQALGAQVFYMLAIILLTGLVVVGLGETAAIAVVFIGIVLWLGFAVYGAIRALNAEAFGYPLIKIFIEH